MVQKTGVAFLISKKIWKAKQTKLNTKVRIFYLKCQVTVGIQLRDMENDAENTEKDTAFHLLIPAQNCKFEMV